MIGMSNNDRIVPGDQASDDRDGKLPVLWKPVTPNDAPQTVAFDRCRRRRLVHLGHRAQGDLVAARRCQIESGKVVGCPRLVPAVPAGQYPD